MLTDQLEDLLEVDVITTGCSTMTYADLREHFVASRKDTDNAKSHFAALMNAACVTDTSEIGEELEDDVRFTQLIEALEAEDVSTSHIKNRRAAWKAIRKLFLERRVELDKQIETVDVEGLGFTETLNKLIDNYVKKTGRSIISLARALDVNEQTFFAWRNGKCFPQSTRIPVLKKLEELLGCVAGTLTSLILCPYGSQKYGEYKRITTAYGAHLSKQKKAAYCLDTVGVYPLGFRKEWEDELVKHKQKAIIKGVNGEVCEQQTWNEYTEKKNLVHTGRFLGFLHKAPQSLSALPDPDSIPNFGLGLSIDKISIAQFSDYDLVSKYIDFLVSRTVDKRYNLGHVDIVSLSLALLAPQYGFFRHHPQYGLRLMNPITSVHDWEIWCDKNLKDFQALRRTINKNVKKAKYQSRNPKERIRDILEKKGINIEAELQKFLTVLENHLPNSTYLRAVRYRNLLMNMFFIDDPVRQKHIRIMEFGKHLIEDPDGTMWLDWPKSSFKNQTTNEDGRRIKLPPKLAGCVRTYRDVHRPLLYGAGRTNLVFLAGSAPRSAKPSDPINPVLSGLVYGVISDCTGRYLAGVLPIGPHAYRRVIMTGYLRDNEGDTKGAAALIGDTEKVAMDCYCDLKQQDYLENARGKRAKKVEAANGDNGVEDPKDREIRELKERLARLERRN